MPARSASGFGLSAEPGRAFTEDDREGQPRVAILNDVAARRYWPEESPLWRLLLDQDGQALEEHIAVPLAPCRLGASMLGLFGILALGLACRRRRIRAADGVRGPRIPARRALRLEPNVALRAD